MPPEGYLVKRCTPAHFRKHDLVCGKTAGARGTLRKMVELERTGVTSRKPRRSRTVVPVGSANILREKIFGWLRFFGWMVCQGSLLVYGLFLFLCFADDMSHRNRLPLRMGIHPQWWERFSVGGTGTVPQPLPAGLDQETSVWDPRSTRFAGAYWKPRQDTRGFVYWPGFDWPQLYCPPTADSYGKRVSVLTESGE